ncbi:MgtC/SapB family protein [Sinimarinibacterium sp. NLF-5-8]|uniref:MgtC/SapB family protein n=1 Tax=Sinimarinibacterium sp. NLF-5-8 TaxID=2698684 RepID=UPI00192ED6D5|nr:MgtC/SapB family protein [Sinimarinibacterium sp. NLF-5-8]
MHVDILMRLALSLVAGSMIGLERSYHARAAGFRTHVLVCTSTALLMLLTAYEGQWLRDIGEDVRIQMDPTRMAQGIMTGIGFLGAGTIMKEGLSVRGLTTAASIWATAALGVLFGIGFYFPAVLGTLVTLLALSVFRWLESRLPTQFYARCVLRFARGTVLEQSELVDLMQRHGFAVFSLSYASEREGGVFEYSMAIRSSRLDAVEQLVKTLREQTIVSSFTITPMSG